MYLCFRYKKPEERQPLVAAMHIFMPMLKERFIQLLPDHSSDSVLIQKQIFKILYALFQVISQHLTFSLCGFDGHHNFQKPKVTSSNCFFCQTNSPKRKDSLTSNMTKKSNKSLYLRSWSQLIFDIVAWKKRLKKIADYQKQKLSIDSFWSVNQLILEALIPNAHFLLCMCSD